MSKDTNACQINVLTGLVFTPGSILNQLPQLHGDPMTNTRDDGDAVALIGRLRARTITFLPRDWYKGRKCPERGCLASAERPKCFFELGGACPRLDPDAYDKSPYVETPDQDCVAAADLIATLSRQLAEAQGVIERLIEQCAQTAEARSRRLKSAAASASLGKTNTRCPYLP